MKVKIVFFILIMNSTLSLANPLVVKVVKEAVKQAPKVLKVIAPLLTTTMANADVTKDSNMSKKDLKLYKTKF